VGGEDRPDRQSAGDGGDLLGRHPPFGDHLGRLVEPAALHGAAAAQVPGAVHLLGDVGQVEVGGEGAGQLGAGGHVEPAEPLGGGRDVGPYLGADLLDEVEQRAALLTGQGLAEEGAEPADVGAQRGVRAVVVVLVGHDALLT
jgi:hypothetical protein